MQDPKDKALDNLDDDSALFRELFADARPIKQSTTKKARPLRQNKSKRSAKQQHKTQQHQYRREQAVKEDGFNDSLINGELDEHCQRSILSFRRDGVQARAFQRFKRRRESCPVIDLHGMTVEPARLSLQRYAQQCVDEGIDRILVIHGKGLNSPDSKPTLKNHVASWLRQMPLVLAYHSARAKDGGAGAVYVLLKKQSLDEDE